jgi:hypothetical protein
MDLMLDFADVFWGTLIIVQRYQRIVDRLEG